MKKLLKGALTLAIATIVGIPQMQADKDPNDDLSYSIQVKSINFSKHTKKGLKGVKYTEDVYPSSPTWPMVEATTKYEDYKDKFTFVANYKDFYNGKTSTNKTCYVKQFGVSMGVVYWIVPTKDVIYYWNTVTGEVGEFTPQKTYDGANYAFDGAATGYGNITQDWYGNLVHQWNNVTGADINTPARGFAIYKAPSTYGEAYTNETARPRLSDMTTSTVPYDQARLYPGSTTDISLPQIWDRKTAPNPNIPSSSRQTLWGKSVGTPVAMDYMGASGDFWGGSDVWAPSTYFRGKASGYVFFAYNNLIFGQIIAEGAYANWYLNYEMNYYKYTQDGLYIYPNSESTYPVSIDPDSKNPRYGHSREFLFRECDTREYFWCVPFTGLYETPGPNAVDTWIHTGTCVQPTNLVENGWKYTDWMSAPEIDSIKGYRVMLSAANLMRHSGELGYRTGSINLSVCEYTNHDYNRETREFPSKNYSVITAFYAYNNTKNTNPLTGHSVNSWNELERVNNNVFALYTHVPGQGFSKYFITAVEEDNPVTYTTSSSTVVEGVKVERRCYSEGTNTVPGSVDALISWNAQKYDRETLNNYEVWYRTYKRDDSGNLVTLCDDTWSLAGTSSIAYTERDADGKIIYYPDYDKGDNVKGAYNPENAPKGSFTHKAIPYGGADTEDTSDDYDIVYEYMVIPIYSASNHRGTEAYGNTTITSSAPRIPVNGTLSQIKEGDKYSFNLKLDVATNSNLTVPFADNKVKASITKYVLVAEDEETATALSQATSVECLSSGMTVTTGKGITPVFASHNCSHYTANGYYAIVEGFSAVSASGTALPSLVWHNVNPEVEYKVKVYGVANRGYNFVETGDITATLTVPNATLSLTEASIHPLVGDYSSLQNNDLLPLGAQRRVGSNEVTNPVTLSNANTLGTKGSAINPLLVTDEVLENWSVKYRYNIFKDGGFMVAYDLDASDEAGGATYYSNSNKVMFDIVGLPIEREAWTIHDKMGLDDAQKAANENITKYGYNTSTVNKAYTAHIDVTYTRKDNNKITTFRGGQQDASSPIVFSDAVKDGAIFPNLGVEFGSQFVALKRDNPHWDENCAENDGYFSVYYDAVAQWRWDDYNDDLNRYVGYHAVTSTNCVGHYVNNSTTWIPYYAPSVLSDYYVEQTNISLGKAGNFTDNNNGAVEPLVMEGIGYDGSAKTNWSALAAKERTLPMQVHYVWGGNSELTDRKSTSTKMLMTADYPIIESIYGATVIHNAVAAINDDEGSYYTLIEETNAGETRMNMISSENHNGVYVDYVTTLTGVEGILVNAAGGVKLYPNPVGSTFTLQAPMAMGEVRIFTTDGQLVKVVKDINDTMVSINVDELPQGMYIVSTLGVAKMMIKK